MKKKVLILGANGMLGSMMTDYLSQKDDIELTITSRDGNAFLELENVRRFPFAVGGKIDESGYYDYVINCIGLIKPRIDEYNVNSIVEAIKVNSLFPLELPNLTKGIIINIATDCCFQGNSEFPYKEMDKHDPTDSYGQTKALGESRDRRVCLLRCSIIGPEYKRSSSLLEWVLSQPNGSEVNGFTNHKWNGLSTLAFAKLCYAIIKNNYAFPMTIGRSIGAHIVPGNIVTKYDLVSCIADVFKKDIKVKETEAKESINRVLTSMWNYDDGLWNLAGYEKPPTIQEMIKELYDYLQNDSIIWKGRFN